MSDVPGMDDRAMQVLAKRSYKFLLHFRHLMLLVLHWPVPGWRPVIWKGVHVAYYPDRGPASFHEGLPQMKDFPSDAWRHAQAAFYGPVGMASGLVEADGT